MWGQLEEEYYQQLVEDLQTNGDRYVVFHNVEGKLSSLIESMKIVRSMCGIN